MWDGFDRRIRKKMLCVDDNNDFLNLMSCCSNNLGIECTCVRKATEFLNEFETGVYDFALIDYQLDLIDGVTLSRLIDVKEAPDTKIYFISVHEPDYVKRILNGDKYAGIFNKTDGCKKILLNILRKDFCHV